MYILWSQGILYRFDISHKLSSIANFAIKENPHDKRMLHSNSKRREKKGKKESRKRTCLLWLPSFYGPTIVSLSSQSKCLSKNVSISQFFPEFSKNMGIEIDVRKKIRDDEEKKEDCAKTKT